MSSKGACERGRCRLKKRPSALTAPVRECTTAGYQYNIEGELERGGTDFPATDGSGTAIVLCKQERNSPLVRACRERRYCARGHCLFLLCEGSLLDFDGFCLS